MQTAALPTASIRGSVKKEEVVAQVKSTHNYEQFKIMADNRNVNLLHVKRLVASFTDEHLICPIIVNEKMEVIDGQHRLTASMETGLPVYYITLNGYGIKEVQRLNTNQKNWNKLDYLQMYCAEAVKPYLQLKQFMDDFPDFGIQSSERITTGMGSQRSSKVDGVQTKMKDFEEGKLSIPDIKRAYLIARKIMEFKPYYKNFHRGTFVSAVMPLIIESEQYSHKEMIGKLQTAPLRLRDCDKVESYRLLLEDIYNYKRQKENKVSFRYA